MYARIVFDPPRIRHFWYDHTSKHLHGRSTYPPDSLLHFWYDHPFLRMTQGVSEGSNVNLEKGVVRAKYENSDEVCRGVETQISHVSKNLQK